MGYRSRCMVLGAGMTVTPGYYNLSSARACHPLSSEAWCLPRGKQGGATGLSVATRQTLVCAARGAPFTISTPLACLSCPQLRVLAMTGRLPGFIVVFTKRLGVPGCCLRRK